MLFDMNHIKEDSAFNFSQVLKFTKYIYGHNGYIAGGCFKNIFKKEKIKDIDLFFESRDDFEEAKSLYESNDIYKELYENDNAVGYLDTKAGVAIDLVKSRFGSPDEMIDSFDFTITKFALYGKKVELEEDEENNNEEVNIDNDQGYNLDQSFLGDSEDEEEEEDSSLVEWTVLFHEKFFEHLMLNRLVIDNDFLEFPLNTFERILRYARYGYSPCMETKVKIVRMLNIDTLPEEDSDLFRGFYFGID